MTRKRNDRENCGNRQLCARVHVDMNHHFSFVQVQIDVTHLPNIRA